MQGEKLFLTRATLMWVVKPNLLDPNSTDQFEKYICILYDHVQKKRNFWFLNLYA